MGILEVEDQLAGLDWLQERGQVFEMMTYPGQRHGIRPPPLQTHLLRTQLAFFNRYLSGENNVSKPY